MKIIVIGATGTIGNAVAKALEPKHEVIRAYVEAVEGTMQGQVIRGPAGSG